MVHDEVPSWAMSDVLIPGKWMAIYICQGDNGVNKVRRDPNDGLIIHMVPGCYRPELEQGCANDGSSLGRHSRDLPP